MKTERGVNVAAGFARVRAANPETQLETALPIALLQNDVDCAFAGSPGDRGTPDQSRPIASAHRQASRVLRTLPRYGLSVRRSLVRNHHTNPNDQRNNESSVNRSQIRTGQELSSPNELLSSALAWFFRVIGPAAAPEVLRSGPSSLRRGLPSKSI